MTYPRAWTNPSAERTFWNLLAIYEELDRNLAGTLISRWSPRGALRRIRARHDKRRIERDLQNLVERYTVASAELAAEDGPSLSRHPFVI